MQHSRQSNDQTIHQRFSENNGNKEREKTDNNITPTDPFVSVNERPVDDISLDFFYKPHTVTLLAVSIIAVMYFAFVR